MDNELWTNHTDYEMFINCYWGNPIPREKKGKYLINS